MLCYKNNSKNKILKFIVLNLFFTVHINKNRFDIYEKRKNKNKVLTNKNKIKNKWLETILASSGRAIDCAIAIELAGIGYGLQKLFEKDRLEPRAIIVASVIMLSIAGAIKYEINKVNEKNKIK